MYLQTQKSGARTRAVGVVAVGAFTVGLGALFTAMNFNVEKAEINATELVMIEPPPPPPIIEEPPPKVEVVEDTPAPPNPPPLVAPDIDFVPPEPPVITAPVADPVILPEPAPVAPSPPVTQSRSNPKLMAGAKPDYPSASRRAGEQGTTHLQVCVSSNGRVTSVQVAGTSGFQRLDDAAARWIRSERFQPARINGVSQDMCGYSVYYEWSLRDA